MANIRYKPVYWEKYNLEAPVQGYITDWVNDYPTLVDSLRADINRLSGEEYRGEDNNRVMRQIADAEREWEQLAKQHVASQAEHYGSRPVGAKKKKPFEGVATLIQKAHGITGKEDRPLNP